ncbi:MAG TPA: hypothetical protein VJ898_06745 [Natrialbaceae archaeon]|nr:hypothetical protein [Natrialbaceae archaeon]
MIALLERSRASTGAAALVGGASGFAVVGVYLGAGLLLADWSIGEFLAHLSGSSIGYFLGTIGLVVAVVGLPIAGALRFGLRTPLVVLVLVIIGWLSIAAVQGLLSVRTIFGIALYAAMLSPLYLVLYGVLGGGEYLYRTRVTGR